MALVINDRVKETSTTSGAGDFTLAGASTGLLVQKIKLFHLKQLLIIKRLWNLLGVDVILFYMKELSMLFSIEGMIL